MLLLNDFFTPIYFNNGTVKRINPPDINTHIIVSLLEYYDDCAGALRCTAAMLLMKLGQTVDDDNYGRGDRASTVE